MIFRDWLMCPVCKNKTRVQIRSDTILENFPLFCPKCKKETIVCVKQMKVVIATTDRISDDQNSYQ